jgi:predicted N-acetyltransferase YhbS
MVMALSIKTLSEHPYLRPIVTEMLWEEFREAYNISYGQSFTKDDIESILEQYNGQFTLIALRDEKLIGFCNLVANDINDDINIKQSPWVANLIVIPSERQKGVGTALMSHMMSMLKKTKSFDRVYLWSISSKLQTFYESFGFHPVGKSDFMVCDIHTSNV